jgi:hypothetical protein
MTPYFDSPIPPDDEQNDGRRLCPSGYIFLTTKPSASNERKVTINIRSTKSPTRSASNIHSISAVCSNVKPDILLLSFGTGINSRSIFQQNEKDASQENFIPVHPRTYAFDFY